mgnify:CR=1 FL=1
MGDEKADVSNRPFHEISIRGAGRIIQETDYHS